MICLRKYATLQQKLAYLKNLLKIAFQESVEICKKMFIQNFVLDNRDDIAVVVDFPF